MKVYVLIWQFSDGSGLGAPLVFDEKDVAEKQLAFMREFADSRVWRLVESELVKVYS